MNLLSVQPEVIPEKIQALLKFVYPQAGKQVRHSPAEDPPKHAIPPPQGKLLSQLHQNQAESCKTGADESQQKGGVWELLLSYGSDEEAENDESECEGKLGDTPCSTDLIGAAKTEMKSVSQSSTTQLSSSASEKEIGVGLVEHTSGASNILANPRSVEGMSPSLKITSDGGPIPHSDCSAGVDSSFPGPLFSHQAKQGSVSEESRTLQREHETSLGPDSSDADSQDNPGMSLKYVTTELKEIVGHHTKVGAKRVRIDIVARRNDTANAQSDKQQPPSGVPKTEQEINEALERLPKASWAAPSAKLNIAPVSSPSVYPADCWLLISLVPNVTALLRSLQCARYF